MTLLSIKSYQNWLMNVEDTASQSRVIFETVYSVTEKIQFMGCMFPQVVQRHKQGEVGQHSTIRQHTHSAISLPKITKIVDVH